MAGKTADFSHILSQDDLALNIARLDTQWRMARQKKEKQWQEVRNYIYATDTSTTTNNTLPWKNRTTLPKLTQIRDNLYANYMATMFPRRKWLSWEGDNADSDALAKKKVIAAYMGHAVEQPDFRNEVSKLVYDYIDYGNSFAMPCWIDFRKQLDDGVQRYGYVGPGIKRISPLDITFNPLAPTFYDSPKIIRVVTSFGELKQELEKLYPDPEEKEIAKELFTYFKDIRRSAADFGAKYSKKQDSLSVDGFGSYVDYMQSGSVELLYFYGTIYDENEDKLYENYKIVVADQHKIVYKAPEKSMLGHVPIFHTGWRMRQDNLWAMGPLDNLVGLQYRIDHLENLKADAMDLNTFPVLKIKGFVRDFDWQPMERIYVGDDGDVEILAPNTNILNVNLELSQLEQKMEEMAGAPKEALGFRSPGEKTMYEVQRLENASSRVFQTKIGEFEQNLMEPALNSMLELSKRNAGITTIKTVDPEFDAVVWQEITPEDLAGGGRIRPMAARHFAEKSQLVQNLNSFFSSPLGQDPKMRRQFRTYELAKMMEDLLQITDYDLIERDVGISEDLDAQRLSQSAQEQAYVEGQTPGMDAMFQQGSEDMMPQEDPLGQQAPA
jgi:hypothetical protein